MGKKTLQDISVPVYMYKSKVSSGIRKARALSEQQRIDELLSIDIAGPQSSARPKTITPSCQPGQCKFW